MSDDLKHTLSVLANKRSEMQRSELYSLGNIYGMNTAIDTVASLAGVDPLDFTDPEEPRHG